MTVSRVTKRFGNFMALDNISLEMQEHGCIGLLGPNGAGKSTLLKSITNIIKPSSGKIRIDGVNVSSNPRKALRNVGSLIEFPRFYPYLTGMESLYFICRVKGISSRDSRDEIERVTGLTGSGNYLDKKTGSYSRGMNQRLALSSAMIGNPGILILDEPTFGLDPKGMKDIRNLIRRINSERESLILLSSHLIYEVNEVCDRTVIINGGRIAYDSETPASEGWIGMRLERIPDSLSFVSRYAEVFRVEGNRLIMKKKEGVSSNSVLSEFIELGIEVDSFGEYDTLEDIYISIVDGSVKSPDKPPALPQSGERRHRRKVPQ